MKNNNDNIDFIEKLLKELLKQSQVNIPVVSAPVGLLVWDEEAQVYTQVSVGKLYEDQVKAVPFKFKGEIGEHVFDITTDKPVYLIPAMPEKTRRYALETIDLVLPEGYFGKLKEEMNDPATFEKYFQVKAEDVEVAPGDEWKGGANVEEINAELLEDYNYKKDAVNRNVFPHHTKFNKSIEERFSMKVEGGHLWQKDPTNPEAEWVQAI